MDIIDTVLEEDEAWRLEFSFGRHGPSLSICYMNCNSLEECQEEYRHLLQHSTPLWANAVRSVSRYTQDTTVFVLKFIEPKELR